MPESRPPSPAAVLERRPESQLVEPRQAMGLGIGAQVGRMAIDVSHWRGSLESQGESRASGDEDAVLNSPLESDGYLSHPSGTCRLLCHSAQAAYGPRRLSFTSLPPVWPSPFQTQKRP